MELEKIIRQIESKDPAIGIGTAAAATGILAARLIIKIAKKSEQEHIKKETEKAKRELAKLIREDIKTYKNYMEAYKSKDDKLIKETLKHAIETPMKIAEKSYRLMELLADSLDKSKKSMALESYGALSLASSSISLGIEITKLNLRILKDEGYEKEITSRRERIHVLARNKKIEIYLKISPNIYI